MIPLCERPRRPWPGLGYDAHGISPAVVDAPVDILVVDPAGSALAPTADALRGPGGPERGAAPPKTLRGLGVARLGGRERERIEDE